ncbi:aminodeoxychorismate synthase component I [Streptococcus sciuri]|uniref:Aminodeoxychorismate synthase component I n=1 Tax=Streptococcus sciuri TaxID=2973939 RepID=A0ABT2F5I9_9STRE|nr:aminodeoxychorismate synthase component I [Streptococcus sciuri]MCS4487746.1 aminodeoxychorismate synthase component I [Streptococcus sciuri]
MHKKTIIDFKDLGKRLIFTEPIEELIAEALSDVREVLDKVSIYQNQGYYVVGYVSYEAAPAFEPHFLVKKDRLSKEYLAYFTVHKTVQEVPFPNCYEAIDMPTKWENVVAESTYQAAIESIHQQIKQGNTYQVNYTTCLTAPLMVDSLAVYNRLVVEQGASYNAYIAHDDFAVVSVSPELFFEKKGRTLTTRPMKGTTKRGINISDDLKNKEWLSKDAKNRSENVMIVDLLRNDMGRISEIDSVQVTRLCQIEQYSTVWQMTSTITSQIKRDQDLLAIFEALFPCGSITGAPKIATMSIIYQLETQARGVYCGTIGLCLPNGDAIFNVAIRSLQIANAKAYYGVGGGITWDSKWEDEYVETQQKSAVLTHVNPSFELLTTAKIASRQVLFLEQHLERLKKASRYFAYPFDDEMCLVQLLETCQNMDVEKNYRCRIRLDKFGNLNINCEELQPLAKERKRAVIVQRKNQADTPFYYFKTTYRKHIPNASYEQIFISADGFLQETSIGNIILKCGDNYYTPPVSIGIVDGIYRNYLLNKGKISEKQLARSDLEKADAIYTCNSVRGLYELTLIK